MKPVKTPCVGICSTVFGDEVCRGCKRFVHEVIDWNSYNNEQKLLVKTRLENLSTQVLTGKVAIADADTFKTTLKQVEVSAQLSETMQVLEVLRKAAKQMLRLEDHGLKALPGYKDYTPLELKELLDAEIHVLSTATYHKNFKPRHHLRTDKQDMPILEQNHQEDVSETKAEVSFVAETHNESEVQIP